MAHQSRDQVGTRERQLAKVRESFQKTVDGIGYEIEAGILPAVVVLNAFGLQTSMSCEGHVSWGRGTPWIDFRIEDNMQFLKNDPYQYEYCTVNYLEQTRFLTRLLEDYYRDNREGMTYRQMYYVSDQGSGDYIYSLTSSQCAAFFGHKEAKRQEILAEAKQGMERFSGWLTKQFLQGRRLYTPPEVDVAVMMDRKIEKILQHEDPEWQFYRLLEMANRGGQPQMDMPLTSAVYKKHLRSLREAAAEHRAEANEYSYQSAYIDLDEKIEKLITVIEKKLTSS